LTRASRVSRPAFFREGRLASASMAFSARAMPRRSAPAWPVVPPPMMLGDHVVGALDAAVTKGSLMVCWCSLFGKYSSRRAAVDLDHWPVPGTRRTRAMASLRRPVAAPGQRPPRLVAAPGVADEGVPSAR
jgi:hypothetical protein